ncbi:MAG: transcriptional regulator NrdR [Thermodesulfobacteriota bacterium]
MKCPFCSHPEDKVIDSRPAQEGSATRRRRECLGCERRFTTYEKVEETLPHVIKKDGTRAVFDRSKIRGGLLTACEKRPVGIDDIEAAVDRLEQVFFESGEREISTSVIGEAVMEELRKMDEVAYVRFASVYREFRDIDEFMSEMKELRQIKKKEKKKK